MHQMQQTYGIHWFRRDLRIRGNPALEWSRQKHSGRVLGLFVVDPAILKRDDFSPSRFVFYLRSLAALREELRNTGGDLLALEGGPEKAFEALLVSASPATVSWNRDYEPFALERDSRMEKYLNTSGVKTHHERDHLIIEPHEILKDDATSPYYKVYGAYRRRWLENFATVEVENRIRSQLTPAPSFGLSWREAAPGLANEDVLERLLQQYSVPSIKATQEAGAKAALEQLRRFESRLERYAIDRDYPAIEGTSGMSIYLKNGSITTAQIVGQLGLKPGSKFLDELIWREFSYYILYHFPHVALKSFNPKYAEMDWENDRRLFEAWIDGRTGYPIVDAGMRELAATGFMHNRVRMIVASFLTKDLLIDWRWGERHFMKALLDGDLAPNNMGWQWAASTGCDPQPYFRIFNPISQGKKFDPEGQYIRRWVPELSALSARELHREHAPIVNHSARRLKALRLFKR